MIENTLKALSEPNRLHIIELLFLGDKSVGDIVVTMKISQPLVSKHLNALKKAGLVEVEIDRQKRIYRLKKEPFIEMESWINSYKKQWESRLDRLDDYLKKMKKGKENETKGKGNERK